MPLADPIPRLGLAMALLLAAAKIGGDVATRFKQPAVLGELLAGVVLGSVPISFVQSLRGDTYVDVLARLGVIILLFEVGLESTVSDVARVGVAAGRVAVLGTIGTLAAGWFALAVALPRAGTLLHLFLASALTATSIGISARVLKDAGASRSREAHTILGASVLDDILGLLVLAVITGAIEHAASGGAMTVWSVGWMAGKTLALLLLSLYVGVRLSPALFALTARLRSSGTLVAAGLAYCFVMAWASSAMGLAPIVGAFAAGLVLEESHSSQFVARGERPLSERVEPISAWLVPIFFVLVGMRAEFGALANLGSLKLIGALAAAAAVGKLLSALGASRGTDRLTVALGMMPRGEVSLVFANLGLSLGLLGAAEYSALVTVVVITTMATPLALRWRLARRGS